jgi:hypothetical protein
MTGGCLCRAVTWSADALPSSVHYCHCTLCRRWTGSPSVERFDVQDNVQIFGGPKLESRLFQAHQDTRLIGPLASSTLVDHHGLARCHDALSGC